MKSKSKSEYRKAVWRAIEIDIKWNADKPYREGENEIKDTFPELDKVITKIANDRTRVCIDMVKIYFDGLDSKEEVQMLENIINSIKKIKFAKERRED
jgi:endonuclease IV